MAEIIKVKTLKNEFVLESQAKFIEKEKIKTDKPLFAGLCKSGCKNYNKKYSCPPFAPDFKDISKNYEGMFVILFTCKLDQIKAGNYNKIRLANSVMKSRMEKLIRSLEKDSKTLCLSTGACRFCKPCRCILGQPCRHPEKRRYSLEATGIDCNELAKEAFNTPLLWYRDKKVPEYSGVICGLFCNKSHVQKIEKSYGEKITKI